MKPGTSIKGHEHTYIIERKLGSGATSQVYLATIQGQSQEQADRVALKVLRPDVGPEIRKSFFLEADILRELYAAEEQFDNRHAIPRLYEIRRDSDPCFLAQELVPGRSLETWLGQSPYYLEEPVALQITAQVARVLHLLHTKLGRSYTDFQLKNIYFDESTGQVQIIDWNHVSAPGQGTPDADLILLGVYLYQMLTGKLASERGESEHALERRAGEHWQALSLGCRQIVVKALHPNPQQRFPSAAAMRDELVWLNTQWSRTGVELAVETGTYLERDLERAEVLLDLARRSGGVPEDALDQIEQKIAQHKQAQSPPANQTPDPAAPPDATTPDPDPAAAHAGPVQKTILLPETSEQSRDPDQTPDPAAPPDATTPDPDPAAAHAGPVQKTILLPETSEQSRDPDQTPDPAALPDATIPDPDPAAVATTAGPAVTTRLDQPEVTRQDRTEPLQPVSQQLAAAQPAQRQPRRTACLLIIVVAVIMIGIVIWTGGWFQNMGIIPGASSNQTGAAITASRLTAIAEAAVGQTATMAVKETSSARADATAVAQTATVVRATAIVQQTEAAVATTIATMAITDTTEPDIVSIDQEAFEQTLFDLPLRVSGQSLPGTEVQLTINRSGETLSSVSIATQDDGVWVWRPVPEEPALPSGAYTLTASIINPLTRETVLATPLAFRIEAAPSVVVRVASPIYTQPGTNVAFHSQVVAGTTLEVVGWSSVGSDEWYYVRTPTSRRLGWLQASRAEQPLSAAVRQQLPQQP
jgi:serine/threonine protein kinase